MAKIVLVATSNQVNVVNSHKSEKDAWVRRHILTHKGLQGELHARIRHAQSEVRLAYLYCKCSLSNTTVAEKCNTPTIHKRGG